MADNLVHPHTRRRLITVDDLPDDVFLEIFGFYVIEYKYLVYIQVLLFSCRGSPSMKDDIESWLPLVHVCRQWRGIVFGSPRRLNLQLCYHGECSESESFRKPRDVWPTLPFPINIRGGVTEELVDKAIPRLKDQICHINLSLASSTPTQIERLSTAMRVPFPELVNLVLTSEWSYASVLPDSFLSEPASRLQLFALNSIAFPGLPKLFLSATNLVNIVLCNIPHSGYISPEAMATSLSTLTRLVSLFLDFGSGRSYPVLKSRHSTRSVIPSLKSFTFKGVNKYLEEFVARIDAPQLYKLSTTSHYKVDFKAPELHQFISRTPTLGPYDVASFTFSVGCDLELRLCRSLSESSDLGIGRVSVRVWPDRQLSTLAQVYTLSFSYFFSTMEDLYVYDDRTALDSEFLWDDIENAQWLELLRPFTAVKNLYLSKRISLRIALALQDLTGGRITELLPALQNVFLEGFQPSEPVQEGIVQLISVRQPIDHPVAISAWHECDKGPLAR